MNILSEILSSKIRAEIFRLLFGLADLELHMREIERRSSFAIGTIQTELKKLQRLDLIKSRKDGNRLYYCANHIHPLYPEIRNMILKTTGLIDVFKKAIKNETNIIYAFIFGSLTKGEENAKSDVDLFVIGDIRLRRLSGLLTDVSEQVGREVNPYIISINEFIQRREKEDHFISRVIEDSKIFITGNEHDFRKLVE